jgi:hypothetical protein
MTRSSGESKIKAYRFVRFHTPANEQRKSEQASPEGCTVIIHRLHRSAQPDLLSKRSITGGAVGLGFLRECKSRSAGHEVLSLALRVPSRPGNLNRMIAVIADRLDELVDVLRPHDGFRAPEGQHG